MATLHHQVAIRAPVAKVYAAIATPELIGTWWAPQTVVQARDGLVLEHDPGPKHGVVRLKVIERIAKKRVEWACVSTHPAASPASAWTGTHFIFEVSERASAASEVERDSAAAAGESARVAGITTLDFRQTGYDETSRFAGFNNFAWAEVLGNLKKVCEGQV